MDGIAFGREDVMRRLRLFDDAVDDMFDGARRFEIVLAGGSALMVQGALPSDRLTTDIDVLRIPPELHDLMDAYGMNDDVNTFYYRFPSGWRDRAVPVRFDGAAVDVLALSVEDLAISKLLAWRKQDQDDIRQLFRQDRIDADRVQSILDDPCEVAANLDAGAWEELGEHWDQIRREEGNDGTNIDIPSLDSQTDGLSFRLRNDGYETPGGRGAR